ncbi:MAG: agmatinase [Phycisphaerales bacterium]
MTVRPDNGRTKLPDPRVTPRFAGLCTFARYPRLEDVSNDALPLDWAFYGIPFDTGTTYRPGARFGPRAIREASQYLKPYHLVHDITVTEILSLADAGDAPINTFDCESTARDASAHALTLADPDHTKLFALGGDHSIALANLRATWARRGKPKKGLALLHVDSHLDTVDQTLGERYSHASPFIRAVEEGLIDPEAMLSVGIKGPLNTKRDLDYARKHGVTIVTCEQYRDSGAAVIRDFLKRLKDRETYVSFDIDAVDPAFAPGTGTLSVGGLSSWEALALVRSWKGVNVVGGDLVEVLPDRDVAGITAMLAAHLAFEIVSLDAVRRASTSTPDGPKKTRSR